MVSDTAVDAVATPASLLTIVPVALVPSFQLNDNSHPFKSVATQPLLCSTDGDDPTAAPPACSSSGRDSTELSPHSSILPCTRPTVVPDEGMTLEPFKVPSHPTLKLPAEPAVVNNAFPPKMLLSEIPVVAPSATKTATTIEGEPTATTAAGNKRTSSPARTMNSTASAGSGGDRPPLSQIGESTETRSQKPSLSGDGAAIAGASTGTGSKSVLSSKSVPTKIPRHPDSVNGHRKVPVGMTTLPPTVRNLRTTSDPVELEHALFVQRILEDGLGVAIRKINQYGKSNLRYVRCITVSENINAATSRSVGSWVVRRSHLNTSESTTPSPPKSYQVLSWGRKKDVQLALTLFTAVRKGKTTDRARRSAAPANRCVSLVTVDPYHPSLDIEAPTMLDRDKFARAFARFLKVPLREEEYADTTRSEDPKFLAQMITSDESTLSVPDKSKSKSLTLVELASGALSGPVEGGFHLPPLPPNQFNRTISDPLHGSMQQSTTHRGSETGVSNESSYVREVPMRNSAAIVSVVPVISAGEKDNDDKSHVSSLTGHGYDQELVEELHNALNEVRAELEESRAEAARAVKVAEQAIQSAEQNNSVEWQNTVTHKAAEAAAIAQKRSASAMAKQRLAEERLEGERRAAAFWRKQAEVAEEEAGALQTRAAAAEVQRAAMEEQIECERRIVTEQIIALRGRFSSTDTNQREALESAMERNRALEMELDATRRDLQFKNESLSENNEDDSLLNKNRKSKRGFGFKKKGPASDGPDSTSLLSDNVLSSSSAVTHSQSENLPISASVDGFSAEQVLKVHAETQLMRQQFELLKRATTDHFEQLPENARAWGEQISQSLRASQTEVTRLQEKLAMESASRRKLLHEVQDLRGAVRVYCRPCQYTSSSHKGLISLPSQDTILLHRDKYLDEVGPISFEFDRVFEPQALQQDVYSELEDVCLGVLDGYKICLMAYGPSRCGKTCTLLGDISITPDLVEILNYGIQLKVMRQLFTIATHRSERYKDVFSLTIIEVHNDRIRDLVAATQTGETRGQVMVAETKSNSSRRQKSPEDDASSGRPSKLEIRTDIHGDTVVQGLVCVEVKSYEEALHIWKECLAVKARRLEDQGLDQRQYDAASHVIATLRVKSMNIATGIGTIGKVQFIDMAAADLTPRRSTQEAEPNVSVIPQSDWRFANRSLETFSECIESRMQFERSVPYRNSTLTHLLRDSLEGDTKVLVIACVSSDPKDINETVSTLKFASRMRRVTIGKATKHILCPS